MGKKKTVKAYPKLNRKAYFFIDGILQKNIISATEIPTDRVIAIDYETISLEDLTAYSVSFAWNVDKKVHSLVLNLSDYLNELRPELATFFQNCKHILGHNILFELRVTHYNEICDVFQLYNKIEDSMALIYVLDTDRDKDLKFACKYVGMDLNQFGQFSTEKEFVCYNRDDSVASLLLWNKYLPMVKKMECYAAYRLEVAVLWPFLKMRINGFKVNQKAMLEFKEEGEAKLNEYRTRLLTIAGKNLNLNSDDQLRLLFYDDWGLVPDQAFFTAGGKAGNKKPGASKGAVEKLAVRDDVSELQREFCRLLLDYKKYAKLLSTFTGAKFQAHIHSDGKIRSNLNSMGTATGRLSSSAPNLLNIPARGEEGVRIRMMYVPSDENHILLDFDWSQIEYRLFTHYSGDKKLIADYQDPKADFHILTGTMMGIPRSDAKNVNFMLVYQGGVDKLAKMIKKTASFASNLYAKYFVVFKGTKRFIDIAKAYGRYKGFTRTLSGKIRRLENLRRLRNGADDRVAVNTPVQGGCADLLKLVMVVLDKEIPCGIGKNDVKMVLQVYDELIFDCPKDMAEEVCHKIKHVMENVYTFSVPLIADGGQGENWYLAKGD